MAQKISVEVDVNTKEVKFAGGEVTRLSQQVRVLTDALNQMQKAGEVGSEKYQILVEKLNDTKDAMDRTKLAAGEIYGTLSAMPGPIGEIGSSLNKTIDSFKLLGSLKTTELRAQFTGLLKDVKEAGAGFLNLIGFTKLYEANIVRFTAAKNKDTTATVINTEATEASAVAQKQAAVSTSTDTAATNVNTSAKVTATVATRAFAAALAALPFVLIGAGIAILIAYWDDLVDAITGASDVTRAYEDAQKEATSQVADFQKKLYDIKDAFAQVKAGTMSKKDALEKYNESLGSTVGFATSLDEAESLMVKNTAVVIESIRLRATAQSLYAKAADLTAQVVTGEAKTLTFWQKMTALAKEWATGNRKNADELLKDLIKRQEEEAKRKEQEIKDKVKALETEADKLIDQAILNDQKLEGIRTKIDKKEAKTQEEKDKEKIDVLNRNIQLEIDSQNTSKENLEKYLTERRALTQKYEKLQGRDLENALEKDRITVENALKTDKDARLKVGEEIIKDTREQSKRASDESLRTLQGDLDKELQKIEIDENKKKENKKLTEKELTQIEVEARQKREQLQLAFFEKQLAIIKEQKQKEIDAIDKAVKDGVVKEEDAAKLRLKIAEEYGDKIFNKEKEIGKLKTDIVVNTSKDAIKANKEEKDDEIKAFDDRIKLLQLQSEGLIKGTRAYFNLRREIIDAAEQQELAALERENLAYEQYEQKKAAITKKYAKQRTDVNREEFNQILGFIVQGFEAFKSVADAQLAVQDANKTVELENAKATIKDKEKLAIEQDKINEKYFYKQKGAQKAQAYISTFQAAVSAYAAMAAIPVVGPVLGAIAAAAAIVAGLANVKKIDATTYTSTISDTGAGVGEKGVGTKFAKGGLLSGPSHAQGGVKTSFGELEGGEYVVNKRSTQSFMPLLSAINSVGNRKYANGGMMPTMDSIKELMAAQQMPIVKTYVVASEMTSQQEANKKLMDLAKI
jgi:hypothetical protein